MPRACRYPRRLKPRPHEMMLTQLAVLTATPIRGEGDQAQLLLCVKFLADSEFTADEKSHITTHLHALAGRGDHVRQLLAPLLALFPLDPITS